MAGNSGTSATSARSVGAATAQIAGAAQPPVPPAQPIKPAAPTPSGGRRALRTAVVWDILRAAVESRVAVTTDDHLDILDAGGGTGGFAVPLAELGHRVTVVDPSPDALAALERRVDEAGVADRVTAVQGDLATIPEGVAVAAFDLALCHGVLEHVDDAAAALAVVRGCLRAEATLSVLAANRHAVVLARALAGHLSEARHTLEDPTGRWGTADPMPRRFAEAELVDLVAEAGFDVRAVHGIRVFSDLVPGSSVDGEPGAVATLIELEKAAAEHPAFRAIAGQIHLLATRG